MTKAVDVSARKARRKFDMEGLGSRLRALREARGLSQYALDEAAGLTRGMVGHYEVGRRTPELAVLVAIAETLKADLYWLLDTTKPRHAAKVYNGDLWTNVSTGTQTRRLPAQGKSQK